MIAAPDAGSVPLALGLHITKCAGTSLMTTLRRHLSEDEYFFFSSYHENWLASRPTFPEIRAPQRLRIAFGHYCHESLLRLFEQRPLFLFTGLREPVARAVSDYRQVNAVRLAAGRGVLAADDYLRARPNALCGEILRCFPSVAGLPGLATWQRARAALSLFDFVYSTERFDTDCRTILAVLDCDGVVLTDDNVSDAKPMDARDAAAIRAGCDEIRGRDIEFLDEDIQLYAAMAPWLGRSDLSAELSGQSWALDRAAFVAGLPDEAACRETFAALERAYLVHEFDELGRLDALRADIRARTAMLGRLAEVLAGYG